uniref:Uncharacterized protein n=1 Tax=Rhodnius prolixus TaxID=13249 RepID=T1I1Q9_RHOPR
MRIPHVTGFHHHQHHHHEHLIVHHSIERTIDNYGFDGRACLMKAFCDLVLIENHHDIISKFLRIIFKNNMKVEELKIKTFICWNMSSRYKLSFLTYNFGIYDLWQQFDTCLNMIMACIKLVYCFLYSTYGTQPGIFVIGFTVGLAWEIPTDLREYFYEHGKEQLHVRDRLVMTAKTAFYIPSVLLINWKVKLFRSFKQYFTRYSSKYYLIAIFHSIFNMGDVQHWLEEEDHLYRHAGSGKIDCDSLFPCNLTLFQQYPP